MNSRRIVYVVDDDDAVRQSVGFLLDVSGYEAVRFASAPAFLEVLEQAKPGCILMDIHMPEMTGLELQVRLREREVNWPLIVLTGQGDVGVAVQAMKAGAFDFLEKPCQNDLLLGSVAAGFVQLESVQEEADRVAEARALIETLTGREREVLQGLLAALPNKIIGYELDISVRTVEIYRANVMAKLRARGLSMAVRIALAAGLQPLVERRTGR
jgi:two-component system response regulator FixJ